MERPRIELNKRGGHIGEINEKWDNGFYTKAELLNSNFEIGFLIDSGSTVSIISKAIFDTLMPEHSLEPLTMSISDMSVEKDSQRSDLFACQSNWGALFINRHSLSVIFVKMEY